MASITFNSLKKAQINATTYIYSDLRLDFTDPIVKDIPADYDQTAIKNSLVNLFNTMPGQNLLNPTYGLNLAQFLFSPSTEATGRLIGQKILQGITTNEPRVKVNNIAVEVNSDEQMYTITLSISMPTLNQQVKVVGTLDKDGFTIL